MLTSSSLCEAAAAATGPCCAACHTLLMTMYGSRSFFCDVLIITKCLSCCLSPAAAPRSPLLQLRCAANQRENSETSSSARTRPAAKTLKRKRETGGTCARHRMSHKKKTRRQRTLRKITAHRSTAIVLPALTSAGRKLLVATTATPSDDEAPTSDWRANCAVRQT